MKAFKKFKPRLLMMLADGRVITAEQIGYRWSDLVNSRDPLLQGALRSLTIAGKIALIREARRYREWSTKRINNEAARQQHSIRKIKRASMAASSDIRQGPRTQEYAWTP